MTPLNAHQMYKLLGYALMDVKKNPSIHPSIDIKSMNFTNHQIMTSWMWRTNHPFIHPCIIHEDIIPRFIISWDSSPTSSKVPPLLSLPLLSPGATLKGNVKTALFGFGSWVSRRCCHCRWWWVKQAKERMTWHGPPYSSERYEDGNDAPYG